MPKPSEATSAKAGDNANAELKHRIARRMTTLDAIAELQEQLKEYVAEDKADGLIDAAIKETLKSMRKGEEWHAERIAFEMVIDTYRRAAGVPTEIEAAQAAAREAIDRLPDSDGEAA